MHNSNVVHPTRLGLDRKLLNEITIIYIYIYHLAYHPTSCIHNRATSQLSIFYTDDTIVITHQSVFFQRTITNRVTFVSGGGLTTELKMNIVLTVYIYVIYIKTDTSKLQIIK